MVDFSVKEATKKEWDDYCFQTPYKTPFMRDDILEIIGYRLRKILVYHGRNPVLGLCAPIDSRGGVAI